MPAAIPAHVTPALLGWAREQSGLSLETVAKRVGVKPDRLGAWESGQQQPTVRQTAKLATVFHRPIGLFFLQQPPAIEPLAAEYRRLPGVKPGGESPEFRLAVRTMVHRRELALELGGEFFAEFKVSGRISDGAVAIGQRVRGAIGIPIEEQLAWPDEWAAWRNWRTAVENAGVLVFQFPKVGLGEARGVALPHFPLPAVGINSKESAPGARVFTLVHELVHLALTRGQEEQVALRETRTEAQWLDLERFAEEAASLAIIPQAALDEALATGQPTNSVWDVARVRALARRFRVTPLAMATRLRSAGVLTWNRYSEWLGEWKAIVATMPPKKGGFATPVEKTLGRAGRPLTQLVLEALDTNRITAVDASRYLELRFDHFEKLRAELGSGTASAGASAE